MGAQRGEGGDLEDAIKTWLAQPGPALLDVKVNPMQLVMPPSPFVAPEAVVGMAVYSAKAMLARQGPRRLGNDCREYSLKRGDSIKRPLNSQHPSWREAALTVECPPNQDLAPETLPGPAFQHSTW